MDIYREDYVGPAYQLTSQVSFFHKTPRFGRTSDITHLLSHDEDSQATYVAGLIILMVFSLTFFIFWVFAILLYRFMGTENAGFLTGNNISVQSVTASDSKVGRRSGLSSFVRALFLMATVILWIFAVLLVAKGVKNVDETAYAAEATLETLHTKIEAAEDFTNSIQKISSTTLSIRDKVVDLFDTVICDNANVENRIGVSLNDLGVKAKDDLTQLSSFIDEYLIALLTGIGMTEKFETKAEELVSQVKFGGWPAALVAGSLFILPAFFVVGVGFAMMGIHAKKFQTILSYFILPIFVVVVLFCIIACCVLLPVAAFNADFCTGPGGGGPDDTLLTSYRNLFGNDSSIRFLVFAYYTQRCIADYYPFNFLSSYYDQLSQAHESTSILIETLDGNSDYIQQECQSDSFTPFLTLASSMKDSIDSLKETIDGALMLVDCEEINEMYVNAIHNASCTHAPVAIGWIYGSLLVISICGMIMITLRTSYLPCVFTSASASDTTKPTSSNSSTNPLETVIEESTDSLDKDEGVNTHIQYYYNRQRNVALNTFVEQNIPRVHTQPIYSDTSESPSIYVDFVIVTPSVPDDVSVL